MCNDDRATRRLRPSSQTKKKFYWLNLLGTSGIFYSCNIFEVAQVVRARSCRSFARRLMIIVTFRTAARVVALTWIRNVAYPRMVLPTAETTDEFYPLVIIQCAVWVERDASSEVLFSVSHTLPYFLSVSALCARNILSCSTILGCIMRALALRPASSRPSKERTRERAT